MSLDPVRPYRLILECGHVEEMEGTYEPWRWWCDPCEQYRLVTDAVRLSEEQAKPSITAAANAAYWARRQGRPLLTEGDVRDEFAATGTAVARFPLKPHQSAWNPTGVMHICGPGWVTYRLNDDGTITAKPPEQSR